MKEQGSVFENLSSFDLVKPIHQPLSFRAPAFPANLAFSTALCLSAVKSSYHCLLLFLLLPQLTSGSLPSAVHWEAVHHHCLIEGHRLWRQTRLDLKHHSAFNSLFTLNDT
jgi:hypothetical protein